MTDILSDDRDIVAINHIGGEYFWRVGFDDVTKIVAYPENGQSAQVPWFAIYVGDEIRWRIDAQGMMVEYGTAPTTEELDAKMEAFLNPPSMRDG